MRIPAKISSVVVWSVISAAFIGPGTITTAISAGSRYQFSLLWAIVFSTIGCLVLQEVSARITLVSGLTLGESLLNKFGLRTGKYVQWMIGGGVIFGCAAYQAGNIVGAVAGLSLLYPLPSAIYTIAVVVIAGTVLWGGKQSKISRVALLLVAIMGAAFITLALSQPIEIKALALAVVTPTIPVQAEMVVLALIGTTIVPYNIFVGAGISRGQTVSFMRLGLFVSVTVGGLITAAIMLAGVSVESFSSFETLAATMHISLGPWSTYALAFGLFAAGFSSAVTAPYAASVVAGTVFGIKSTHKIAMVWLLVLACGFVFGISGTRPIPIILTAQALNGFILPFITLYLILVVNDRSIVKRHRHGYGYNALLLVILFVIVFLSVINLLKLFPSIATSMLWSIAALTACVCCGYAVVKIYVSKKEAC